MTQILTHGRRRTRRRAHQVQVPDPAVPRCVDETRCACPYMRTGAALAAPVPNVIAEYGYCSAVPPPPGAICASVGATAVAFQKMVPVVVLPNERLPLVWKVTGTALTT